MQQKESGTEIMKNHDLDKVSFRQPFTYKTNIYNIRIHYNVIQHHLSSITLICPTKT
jgi:hypothetical protein